MYQNMVAISSYIVNKLTTYSMNTAYFLISPASPLLSSLAFFVAKEKG